MQETKLEYVHTFTDRHGKVRRYFRKPGCKRIPLPGSPGSPEFMQAYQAALAGETAPSRNIGSSRIVPGTLDAAINGYLHSRGFEKKLAKQTQYGRRRELERLRVAHGSKKISHLEPRHIEQLIGEKDTPSTANSLLKALRGLMDYCVKEKLCSSNPSKSVKFIRDKTNGFHTWTEEELAAFETIYPEDTEEWLAYVMALYTALRAQDLIRIGPRDVRNGVLYVTPLKTENSTGVSLAIPIHPILARAIARIPVDQPTFLLTRRGKPFSRECFTIWFSAAAKRAGLSNCTAHGLRKAACRRLAEAGCTALEIMAISGHTTLKEVERYTKAADKKQMAVKAMRAMEVAFPTGLANDVGKPTEIVCQIAV